MERPEAVHSLGWLGLPSSKGEAFLVGELALMMAANKAGDVLGALCVTGTVLT